MYLACNTNNLSQTVLSLFVNAIDENNGLCPSRIRVDFGVENVLVCDYMTEVCSENRGSFIAGASTRNQRIERLWRDVFRCVCVIFYHTFYAMEQMQILNPENSIHLFALHLVFCPRINVSFKEFVETHNNHSLSTEHNWTPNQIRVNGMMNPDNPLVHGALDDDCVDDLDHELYGYDQDAPCSMENGESNLVIVDPVTIPFEREIRNYVLQQLDPVRSFSQLGIDVYSEAFSLIMQKLQEFEVS